MLRNQGDYLIIYIFLHILYKNKSIISYKIDLTLYHEEKYIIVYNIENKLHNNKFPKKRQKMSSNNDLKQGNVYTYQVPQNSATYVVRMALTGKGLWVCIQQSLMQWKLTISEDLVSQTVAKASANKQSITYKQFINAVVSALKKQNDKWSIGIMTPIQLEMLRGGNASKQSNTNKLYLILSDKSKKLHLPFTLALQEINERDRMIEAIRTMKEQLDELRINNDKSQTSFSIMSESTLLGDQLKMQNQQLKKKIKIYEQSLTQKRGAVQIDTILRQKNNLQLQAQTKKRQQNKQITRLKNVHALMDRQINQLKNQVDLINKQLLLLQDNMGNPAKLKSHAMRVLKTYENDLRTSKKVLMKQTKDIQALRRNIQTSKNNEKKNLAKIKQIQTQIQQAKKKANIKEISNRLHSHNGSKNGGSSAGGSQKAPSIASDQSDKRRSGNRIVQSNNLVRQNLLNRTSANKVQRQRSLSNTAKNQLLKTTPNINTPSIQRKSDFKPPARPVVSSHVINNQGSRNSPARPRSKQNDWNSAKSSSAELKKRQFSPAQRQKQKKAMQRLTGAINKNPPSSKPAITSSSSNKNITKNSNTKISTSVPKKDNNKDILNRMKQIKAQYNTRSRNSAVKQQGIAAKIAELTSKKQLP